MTDDPHGWPDPARPGVPMNPERDGWHWVQWPNGGRPQCEWWRDNDMGGGKGWAEWRNGYIAAQYRYLGPCLTPAEVAAREAAAAEAMREEARKAALAVHIPEDCSATEAHGRMIASVDAAHAIDALPTPAPGALDRAREEARREGMEIAAGIAATRHEYWGHAGRKDKAACDDIVAAIRARMEEGA